jgi:radical SAM protein with 4Fe4S-binding SPASM domain
MKITNVTKENIALFNNIGIETGAKCNRHCYFCPNDYFKRPDEYMSDNLIEKIFNELRYLNYSGRIEFYIYNEPTRDKRLLHIIKAARLAVPRATLMFSTNGDYMKGPFDIIKCFDAGLNQMLINIYSSTDGSKDQKVFDNGVKKAEERKGLIDGWVKQVIAQLPNYKAEAGLYNPIGASKQYIEVQKKFGVKRDSTTQDNDFESISNRAGRIEGFRESVKEPLAKHCTKPFRFLNINWTGEAMVCCNDFNAETKMGNVKEKSLVEIWNSDAFHVYRLRLQNKNRNQFLCAGCDSNGGYYPHMVNGVTFGAKKDKEILNLPFIKDANKVL